MAPQQTHSPDSGHRKRKSEHLHPQPPASPEAQTSSATAPPPAPPDSPQEPKAKKSRTNTPWTPAEELRLKQMRDAGNSWSEIAKVSEGSGPGEETVPRPIQNTPGANQYRRFRSAPRGVSRSTGTRWERPRDALRVETNGE